MKKLIVTTDFSDQARNAYGAAVSLASAYQAQLQLVHQAELPRLYFETVSLPVDLEHYGDQLEAKLEEELRLAPFQNVDASTHLILGEQGAADIAGFAEAEEAELIVMASHGRTGLAHALLGSFTEIVARKSVVPVLTYRAAEGSDSFEPRTLLVPLDLSENANAVFPVIRQLAERFDLSVRCLHIFPEVSVHGAWGQVQERLRVSTEVATKTTDELRSRCGQALPDLQFSVDSRFGDPYREILHEIRSTGPDLVVMSTHGLTGIRRLYFGSVAEKLIRTSPCSVLTVRPKNIREQATSDEPPA